MALLQKGGPIKKYTLEAIPSDTGSAPSRYRLWVDGTPTVIAISDEEVALLQHNGPNIQRRALENLFKSSPTRKERLARIPR
jgi:hypothetical protein